MCRTMFYVASAALVLLPVLESTAAGQSDAKESAAVPQKRIIEGQITNADAFDAVRTNSHQKTHFYEMIPGHTYTIDMSAAFDTYLRLEDPRGNRLAENDDFQGLNSRIVYSPTVAGKYRIIATTLGGGATGFYTLSIQPSKGAFLERVFRRIQGQLTKQDPGDSVRKNCHARFHSVPLEAGNSYVIASVTEAYDGYLRLENVDGKQLAENDDYRDTRHSRIVFTPRQSAIYRIVVTTFSPGATGSYSLTITQQQPR